MEHVTENLSTFARDDALTPQQEELIERCRDIIINTKAVACTGCSYCMECPSGVDIPKTFYIYNQYKLFHNANRLRKERKQLMEEGHWAERCVGCGACLPLCPQGIAIPDILAGIEEKCACI
jgi:predicted aldo/keto reductase-like oxidoreductase